MLTAHKEVGETPLELLNRLRTEHPELKDEVLSYAGRLDPMAEGEMLVLIGEQENKEHKKHFGYDKEYEATFCIGMTTDTGDALGLITKTHNSTMHSTIVEKEVEELVHIQEQIYPWFSGKTVNGIKLFDHFKAGRTDTERPTLSVTIKKAELVSLEKRVAEEVHRYIRTSITKVHGDFRQEEILEGWDNFFSNHTQPLQLFTVHFHVTSGTFIRALTKEFSFPVTLLTLKRTKIQTQG